MRSLRLVIAAGVALAASPALAQATPPSETVKAIIAKGSKIEVAGQVYEQNFKADGTYTGLSADQNGKWRADGKKLCMTPDALGQELCNEHPDGKKAGDTYEVQSDFGPLSFTIKP